MKNKLVSACFLLALIATAAILGLSVNIAPAQSATASYTFSGFIYDSTGNVAPNAHIYLINQANGRSAAQDYSDITGFYSMSVPSGTYNLVSRLIGSSQSYSKNNLVINGDTLMDISLVVGYKISGRVFDSSGRTVAGILTNVFNDEWTVPGVSSDASGYYTIYAPAGTYNLAFWPPLNSHLMTFVNNSFIVSSDMNYDVVMSSGFEVSGFVKYPSGDKVIGATTYLVNGSGYILRLGASPMRYGYPEATLLLHQQEATLYWRS